MLSENECRDKCKTLRALQDDKTELKRHQTELQEKIDRCNSELAEYFEINEIQNIKLEGHGMFYLKRTELPQIEDPEAVKKWLKSKGDLDMLMSFNTNKFRSYWKELAEDGKSIPNVNSFIKTEIGLRRS